MHRPRPSILMAISRSASSPVNFSLVTLTAERAKIADAGLIAQLDGEGERDERALERIR